MALEFRDGAIGPAKLFEQLVGDDAKVVLTIVCGDNYAVEHQEQVTAAVLEKIRTIGADLFAAGADYVTVTRLSDAHELYKVIEAAQAGATAIIQPGGSIRDEEVIAAADELNLAMAFTGVRVFRH